MNRRLSGVVIASVMLMAAVLPAGVAAQAPTRPHATLPAAVTDSRLRTPLHQKSLAGSDKIAKSLRDLHGPVRVFVRLSAAPAASVAGLGAGAMLAQVRTNRVQQAGVITAATRLDRNLQVLGRTARASNVVALRIDATKVKLLAADPAVVSVTPVVDYQLALSETVPYIGATTVQRLGFKGRGIRIGVVDSGIDYTHKEFGGPGTLAAYEAAYGTDPTDARNTTTDGLFPTAKVVGGYDFIGESWPGPDPNAPEAEKPDPDPIDFEGHGTHVADIIGGLKGVAPAAKLYALKVCSAVSTSCSGVGLLQAVDWAVDPNNDGNTRDHLDILNMSLGSDYSSAFVDDLSLAVDQASRIGVLTVAAAGNGGDKPFVAGTPAAATSALSVAQTEVPSARAYPLVVNTPASIADTYPNTATVEWAPLGSGFTGDVAYVGRGCPAGSVSGTPDADTYLADPSGKVALIDRGACSISLKVDRAAKAGAVAVLIGLVAPGNAVSFSFGGGDTFVPTMVITQDLSLAMQDVISAPVHVTVSSAVFIPLVGGLATTSSRGPSVDTFSLKPEIGAPGASVSAIAGSGDASEAFGGTSGATPMVTGSAALLKGAFPRRKVNELKAVLMNTAETTIYNNPANTPGYLAPITRIGGGEVRVDRALLSPAAAWASSTGAGALSFGFVDATAKVTKLTRHVVIRNYSGKSLQYRIRPTFRFADDRLNGAVRIIAPTRITIAKHTTRSIAVTVIVYGQKLREWALDSGANALAANVLDELEYDGYLNFDNTKTHRDDKDPLHLAWQVLPRLSGNVSAADTTLDPNGTVALGGPLDGLPAGATVLANHGVGTATVDAYSLVGSSPRLPGTVRGGNAPVVDIKSVGVQTYPDPAGDCGPADSYIYSIAVSAWTRQTIGSYPGTYEVFLDLDRNKTPDYVVFNAPVSGLGSVSDVRTLTWVENLATGDDSAYFFADHGVNDSNMVLTFCGDQIGQNALNFGQTMDMSIGAFDNYYTGRLTDSIEGMTVAPAGERYLGILGTDGYATGDIARFSSVGLTVADFGTTGTNAGETGLLLLLNATRGETRGGAPNRNESMEILINSAP